MNRLTKKMRSGKGASITFALLLFLVCAVVCSVVLAAASAASGRMAGIAETDQRYYSVTSACGLLRDLVDGKSASVVKVAGKDGNGNDTLITYVFDIPAYEVAETDISRETPVTDSSDAFTSITRAAAYKFVTTNWESVGDPSGGGNKRVTLGTYELSSGVRVNEKDPLKVTVEAAVDIKGNVIFSVQSIPDKPDTEEKQGNRFKQRMFFSGTVTKDTTSVTHDGPIDVKDATTLTWTLTSVTTT